MEEHGEALLAWMGIVIRRDTPEGVAVAEMPINDRTRNRAGVLNGGAVATLLDTAGGTVAARATGSQAISTSGLNIQYLAPATLGPARATARVVRVGRRSVVATIELTDTGDDDRICAIGTIQLALRG